MNGGNIGIITQQVNMVIIQSVPTCFYARKHQDARLQKRPSIVENNTGKDAINQLFDNNIQLFDLHVCALRVTMPAIPIYHELCNRQ